MITADGDAFAVSYKTLAIATRVPADREGGAAARLAYFETMQDLPIAAVVEAASELQRTARFFPTVSEWAEVAERIVQGRPARPIVAHVSDDDPAEVAKARTARASLVAGLRARGRVHGIDWPKLAEVFARMPIRLPPAVYCARCHDTGWEGFVCRPAARCQGFGCRDRARDPAFEHDYVSRCGCNSSNPILMARRAADAARRTTGAATRRSNR